MCRHNDFFYKYIGQLVPGIIAACGDGQNAGCRKFGSFAIGNIAFHSHVLYGELASGIPALIGLLADDDEKTRANAAGALGNLVRNSTSLVADMIKFGAVEGLVGLVKAADKVLDSSVKISLFSLGNLAMHSSSRNLLLRLGCIAVAERVGEIARTTRDLQAIKYCDRLLVKLDKPATSVSSFGG
jgi:fused-like protein